MILVALQIIACTGVIFGGPFFLSCPICLAVQALGLALGCWAVVTLRRFNLAPGLHEQARLVIHGPYRVVRNPMYLALLLVFTPPTVLPPYPPFQLAAWTLLLVVLALKVREEERVLRDTFPAYLGYAARTKRLIPGIW